MKKLLLTVITISCLLSCKKDEQVQAKTRTQLLTDRFWKQVKVEQRFNPSDPWTDMTSSISSCDLDNHIAFSILGIFMETEGATKCNAGDPDEVLVGNWTFQSSETVLQLTAPSVGTVNLNILTLDENTLKYTIGDPSVPIYQQITMSH
jgi:hypothetical protein